MKKISWFVLLVVAVGLVGLPTLVKAAPEKFAVVDIQRVLDSVEEGKKAKADFEKVIKKKKDELDRQRTELQKLTEDFEKQRMILSKKALEEKQKELQSKQMAFQQLMMTAQKEMQEKEVTLTGQILKRIRTIVEEIGRKDKFDMIFEKGDIVYTKSAYDITDRVVKTYDKNHK